jgi:uncharacterized protein (DUF4415 family)
MTQQNGDHVRRDLERGYTDADLADAGDSSEWTAEDFRRARPFAEVFPAAEASIRRARGPQKAPTKQQVTLRLDRDVIDHFKSGGKGWQVRMGEALKKVTRGG